MKKINYLVFMFLVIFASCENATEIVQDGEINDAVTFTSPSQMKLYLEEGYDRLTTQNSLNNIALSAILTDEVGVGRIGTPSELYRQAVTTVNEYSRFIWLDNYTVINYCNRVIRGSQSITPVGAADIALYNSVLAQARALRAYCHLELLTYFSTNMKDNNALGVIKMDRVPTVLEELPRNTNLEIYNLIESDLVFAAANIAPTANAKPWTYVTLPMINALRARMYAYRGIYNLAEQFADNVINTSGLVLTDGTLFTNNAAFYATNSNNQYKRMFQDQIRGEVIWSIGRVPGKQTIGSVFNVNSSAFSGISTFEMNRSLFNILDNNGAPWDVRRRANIDPTSIIDPSYATSTNYQVSDVLVVDKYSGIANAQLTNDIKVFRLSEMFLIKAEARAQANDLAGVGTILKRIRDARSTAGPRPLPTYANVTEAWADILLERRVELCFEGHRYIDLKRLGALANKTIERDPKDCSFFNLTSCSFPVTDYRFTLPIHLNETTANRNIQQAPGY
jgi:starch-binding outer membrane protein, SusD/RagB family